jgi:hypothetical protein
VTALAGQLAVAVQNARLHEQLKRRDAERREALEAEQQTSRTLRSLYEISRTFAQSLSLETTLEALVRTFTELLGLDAVGIRMPMSAPRRSSHRPCTFATSEWPRRSRRSCCGHSRCRRAYAASSPAVGRCCSIPASPPSWAARTVCSSRFSSAARRPQSFRSRRRRRCSAPSHWCRSIQGGRSARATSSSRSLSPARPR